MCELTTVVCETLRNAVPLHNAVGLDQIRAY